MKEGIYYCVDIWTSLTHLELTMHCLCISPLEYTSYSTWNVEFKAIIRVLRTTVFNLTLHPIG